MRSIIGCMAFLAGGFVYGFVARGDDPTAGNKHEMVLEQMSGTWRIVAGTNQGKKLSKAHLEGSQVLIEENTIVVLDPDEKELYKAKFQLNISTSPYQIDMISDNPKIPKSLATGIFEFRKGGWRLCYGLPGADRPEKFASPSGSQLMLFALAKAETNQEDNVNVKPIQAETIKEHKQTKRKTATTDTDL